MYSFLIRTKSFTRFPRSYAFSLKDMYRSDRVAQLDMLQRTVSSGPCLTPLHRHHDSDILAPAANSPTCERRLFLYREVVRRKDMIYNDNHDFHLCC
jgi:hypothetical protein